MTNFPLEIVTPDRMFFSGEVESVIVRGVDGDLAVLKNRAPLVTPLKIGKVRIRIDGKEKVAALCSGYIIVSKEKTTIISDSAEWPEEIDIKRAEEAKKRAEKRLKEKPSEIDTKRAKLALRRALNRLDVAKMKNIDSTKNIE